MIKVKLKFLELGSVSLNETSEISCIQKEVRNLLASQETKEPFKFNNPLQKRLVKSHSSKNHLPT